MDTVAIAQVAAAIGTLILALLTFAYVLFTRRMVEELRETRVAQDRPQVIVDADYSDPSVLNVVVRNIGKGAAKDITFDFSTPLLRSPKEGSDIPPINELPYFKEGIDYLAPGAEISSFWDSYITLFPYLEEHGPKDGFIVTSRYKSLNGDQYETQWKINPLLLRNKPYVRRRSMDDLVRHVEKLSKNFERVIWAGELRVATKTERKAEAEELRAQMEAEAERPKPEQDQ
jgi:hypothetical protein